jgi:hypothetical protein
MRDHRLLLSIVVLIVGLAGAACGTSGEGEPGPEQKVPFIVCKSSDSWTRPSEEDQAHEVWSNPRYAQRDAEQLREFLYEDFFAWHGGGSEAFDLGALHGLWSIEDPSPSPPDPQCDAGPGLSRGESISVYLLLHKANDVTLSGNTYRITVEEAPAGYQRIEFANLLFPEHPTEEYPQIDYTVVIVDMEGKELARSEAGGLFHDRPSEGP